MQLLPVPERAQGMYGGHPEMPLDHGREGYIGYGPDGTVTEASRCNAGKRGSNLLSAGMMSRERRFPSHSLSQQRSYAIGTPLCWKAIPYGFTGSALLIQFDRRYIESDARRCVTPRNYSMDQRRAAVAETRRRIVEATLALHAEKGIFDTSWKDIAERADVSTATVYNHFPSLDQLVPACGALIMAITDPPSLEDAPRIFGDAQELKERLQRLTAVMFDFYARGEPYLEVGPKERQLPMVQAWEAGMRATREGLTREALRWVQPSDSTVRAVSALLDFPVFKSFLRHGISIDEAEAIVSGMLLGWLGETPGDR